MVYKYGFCPHCGKKISIYNNVIGGVYSDYIDFPYKKCPYCNEIYNTGKKLYSEMNQKEKEKIDSLIIREAFHNTGVCIVIFGTIFGFICMVLSWIGIEVPRNSMLIIFFIICIFSFVKGCISAKQVLKQIKNMSINDL